MLISVYQLIFGLFFLPLLLRSNRLSFGYFFSAVSFEFNILASINMVFSMSICEWWKMAHCRWKIASIFAPYLSASPSLLHSVKARILKYCHLLLIQLMKYHSMHLFSWIKNNCSYVDAKFMSIIWHKLFKIVVILWHKRWKPLIYNEKNILQKMWMVKAFSTM